jgi:hypothetical protein
MTTENAHLWLAFLIHSPQQASDQLKEPHYANVRTSLDIAKLTKNPISNIASGTGKSNFCKLAYRPVFGLRSSREFREGWDGMIIVSSVEVQ